MNSIKISVIIPVYNVEKYIKKAIESVINQTYKNLEIILVDDGSTDNSGFICDEYANIDERITVIHKENGGIVSARKTGINLANGDYAVNLDPDDWIEATAYEQVVKIIEERHPDIIAYGMKKEFNGFIESQPIQLAEGQYNQNEFWIAFCNKVSKYPFYEQPIDMSQCDKVVKTELFKKHQSNCNEALKKNVDDAVIFPMLLDMKSIYIESRCWYHYCVRKTSILWQTKKDDDIRYKMLALHLIDAYKRYNKMGVCSKEFLLYKLVYHMMLDIPDTLFEMEQCKIYPQIKKSNNIVIYGKGVFANRFIENIRMSNYCNIVENVDSNDVEKLKNIDVDKYDYIVIAIFSAAIVLSIIDLLKKMNIDENKILFIEKNSITPALLPDEVRKQFLKL
jgi:glycosyltransferase involved in cell wall biosynthesis